MHRSVLRLALPSILANCTIPLVGLVDVAIIGHMADATAVAGIALGTMLFDLLYWNFGFLRTGTSGLTAQAYGRGDDKACTQLLAQGLRTALLVAVIMWLLQWLFVEAVLWCVPCSAEAAAFAQRYFFVRIWAAPATLMLMALKGWFIGMQNTRASMVVDIVVNLANMLFSWLLAIHICGPIGVAWGTLTAQYVGLLTAVVVLMVRYKTRLKGLVATVFSRKRVAGLFRLNANLFVRSVCMLIIYVGYTAIASAYGDTELAVSNLYMKYFLLFSYFADGFAYAGEALVGKEGATDTGWMHTERVSAIVRALMVWAIGIGLLGTIAYGLGASPLLRLLTDDAQLLGQAKEYYLWLALMPLASSLAFVWDGIYIGKADGPALRNSLLWAAAAFVLCYGAGQYAFGIQALYAAYFLHLMVRSVYLSLNWFTCE